jgi:hypothetical protein
MPEPAVSFFSWWATGAKDHPVVLAISPDEPCFLDMKRSPGFCFTRRKHAQFPRLEVRSERRLVRFPQALCEFPFIVPTTSKQIAVVSNLPWPIHFWSFVIGMFWEMQATA